MGKALPQACFGAGQRSFRPSNAWRASTPGSAWLIAWRAKKKKGCGRARTSGSRATTPQPPSPPPDAGAQVAPRTRCQRSERGKRSRAHQPTRVSKEYQRAWRQLVLECAGYVGASVLSRVRLARLDLCDIVGRENEDMYPVTPIRRSVVHTRERVRQRFRFRDVRCR